MKLIEFTKHILSRSFVNSQEEIASEKTATTIKEAAKEENKTMGRARIGMVTFYCIAVICIAVLIANYIGLVNIAPNFHFSKLKQNAHTEKTVDETENNSSMANALNDISDGKGNKASLKENDKTKTSNNNDKSNANEKSKEQKTKEETKEPQEEKHQSILTRWFDFFGDKTFADAEYDIIKYKNE